MARTYHEDEHRGLQLLGGFPGANFFGKENKAVEIAQAVQEDQQTKTQQQREHGVVKWFRNSYGFLTRSDGTQIFAHEKDIDMKGFRTLHDGQEVTFEVEDTAKGLKAVKIKPLD